MRVSVGLIALLAVSSGSFARQPATQPITLPTTDETIPTVLNSGASDYVLLWDIVPPAPRTPGPATRESIVERKNAQTGERDRVVRGVTDPGLWAFLPANARGPLTTVIVIPGGGYSGEVFDREGFLVARALRDRGIAAFVLKYRLPEGVPPAANELPAPVADVLRAVRLIRSNAEKYNLDQHRIGVMGFSAGGHVAGSAATQFDAGDANANDPIAKASSRPDFAVLMYAVSSMHESVAHAGSRKRLLGDAPTKELEDRFSTAQRITKQTPPLLLIHANDDKVVKYQNSEEVAAAAKAASVPYEFITYETGGHGFGLARPGTEPEGWIDQFFAWLDTLDRK